MKSRSRRAFIRRHRPPLTAGRQLEARGKARSGVAGVYHVHDFAKEKRAAHEAWDNQIKVILAQASGANVTPLRKA